MRLQQEPGQRLSSDDALSLWKEYRSTGDQRLRNRLVLTFAPLVKYIVFKKIRELPPQCEIEDFISCGLEALMTSIDRYDPEKGAPLERFFWTRIHGAVIDELRRQDWAPRSVRRWERDMTRAREQFSVIHGRRPSPAELAEALATTEDELRMREEEIAAARVGSLNAVVAGDDGTQTERIATIATDDAAADPEAGIARTEAKQKLRAVFSTLPRRDREVAVLLYAKDLTLRESGELLGISESRVCQIHSALKRKIRDRLQHETALFSEVA
jgi:RNA polymerase sigma factor FliA